MSAVASVANGKGKQRATPSALDSDDAAIERSPLLPETSAQSSLRHGRGPLIQDDSDEEDVTELARATVQRRRRARGTSVRKLVTGGALLGLLVVALAVAGIHIWLGHLVSEQRKLGTMDEAVARGMVIESVTSVNILPAQARSDTFRSRTHDGFHEAESSIDRESNGFILEVTGRGGMDVRKALGWETKASGGWFKRAEDRFADILIQRLRSVNVDVGTITAHSAQQPLISIDSIPTLSLPLSYPTRKTPSQLGPFTLTLPLSFPSPEFLGTYLQQVWRVKKFDVDASVARIEVFAPRRVKGALGWMLHKAGKGVVGRLDRQVAGELPANVPSDPSELVKLDQYSLYETITSNTSAVSLSAVANLTNPLYHSTLLGGILGRLALDMPWSIPLCIYLPSSAGENATDVLLAKVSTAPFGFADDTRHASLNISGQLVSTHNLTSPSTERASAASISTALSHFMATFLAGQASTIHVRYDPTAPPPRDTRTSMPTFVSAMMRNIVVPLEFPGSVSKVALFKNLQIEEMKIRLSPSNADTVEEDPSLLCSGRVVGEINLPAEMRLGESIDIRAIFPDVFVYDGEPPVERRAEGRDQLVISSSPGDIQTASYPPSPTPLNSFARLLPRDFIDAVTLHVPGNATHASTTYISAVFIDAPLYMLEGRTNVFRGFISKLIFGGKAKAGIRGVTGVKLNLRGLGGLKIERLPIEGTFFVGRQNPTLLTGLN